VVLSLSRTAKEYRVQFLQNGRSVSPRVMLRYSGKEKTLLRESGGSCFIVRVSEDEQKGPNPELTITTYENVSVVLVPHAFGACGADQELNKFLALRSIPVARQLLERSLLTEAKLLLEAIAELYPTSAEAHYLLGFAFTILKSFEQAKAEFNLALKLGFDEFWVLYNRGSLYLDEGDYEAAVSDLERAVALNISHTDASDLLITARRLVGCATSG
jgi:tetratricopeptide (TPR) repeat protein